MKTDVWRHLVAWEVRHALRSLTFWLMLLLMAVVPVVCACCFDHGSVPSLNTLLSIEALLLSLQLSLWTVFAVKRQVAADVSDDWLLVVTYRQSLISRYLAAFVLGFLLLLASGFGAVVLAWLSGIPLAAALAGQTMVAGSILQAVALASIIVAAADFLVAPTAVVLFVLLILDALWCCIPFAGFVFPASELGAALTSTSYGPTGGFPFAGLATAVCFLALMFGWWKAEDFWVYLKAAHRRNQRASLGEVRGVVSESDRSSDKVDRSGVTAFRERLVTQGWNPLWAHDLARYPLPPMGGKRGQAGTAAWVILLALWVLYQMFKPGPSSNLVIYFGYFSWWVLATAVVLRTLSSGANIVVQEIEQGTLGQLLVCPASTQRLLGRKLGVVLLQAVPALAIMWVYSSGLRLPVEMPLVLTTVTFCCAVGGVLGSSLSSTRLLAMLVAGLLSALLTGLTLCCLNCWYLVGETKPTVMLLLAGLWCTLGWILTHPFGDRALRANVIER